MAQSRTRRLVRRAPRTASLALSGAPNGRHQRSQMRTMIRHCRRPSSVQIPRWKRSTSRERDQDRQQMAAMNAASFPQGHDRAAAIRRLSNHGRRAKGVRIRRSEQRLRARVRRTICARWNLNFAWRRPVPGPRRRRRPLENTPLFFVLLVLPLSQRPFARWGHPYPHSDAVSICVVLVRNATPHRCDVRCR